MDSLKKFEVFDFNSSSAVVSFLYGIIFTLYCLCSWPLYHQLRIPDKRRQAKFSLGYITLLFACSTILVGLNIRMIQLAYLNHSDFPGGPLLWEFSHDPFTSAFQAIGGIVTLIIEGLTMAIQIWRLWLIWSGTRYAILVCILPILLLLTYIGLDLPLNVVGGFISFDQLGISEDALIAMQTAAFGIVAAFTILVTALITTRLLLVRRKVTKIMGMSEVASPYLSIAVMLIESYALSAAWSLATTITYVVNDPSRLLFGSTDAFIQVITYFLIIYRVANGKGWTRQTEGKLATLQWNHGPRTTTDEMSGISPRVPATTSTLVIDSLPIARYDSAA